MLHHHQLRWTRLRNGQHVSSSGNFLRALILYNLAVGVVVVIMEVVANLVW